jgi:pilus assembly protein CpaC
MRRVTQRLDMKELFRPILLTVVASLTVAAAGPKVHAYLAEKSFFGLRPSFEQLIPNGQQMVPIYAGSAEDTLQRIELEKGKSVVLAADFDVERVAVGDPAKVGIVMTDRRNIQLVAKEPGDTNVLLWDAEGKLQTALDLHVGIIHNQLFAELERALGSKNVRVAMAGQSVILKGTVYSIEDRERAEQIAMAFFEGQEGFGEKDPHVINLIDVAGNHQVMLEVVIAELSRSIDRELSTDWQALVQNAGRTIAAGSLMGGGALAGDISGGIAGPGGGLFGGVVGGSTQVRSFLRIARQKGLAKILAEPTLVARSGQKASFLVGGEIPLLEPSGLGTVSVELKPFGVGIDFLPTVLGPDRIHLETTSEVSEPDDSLGIRVQDIFVPGFNTRRASTAVELGDGQSFVIAGLLEDRVTSVMQKVPGIGDIPILGALFQSEEFQRNETELVIIVTPHLVKPLGPGPRPLPTDHYQEPDDVDFFVLGRDESRRPHHHEPTETAGHRTAASDAKE